MTDDALLQLRRAWEATPQDPGAYVRWVAARERSGREEATIPRTRPELELVGPVIHDPFGGEGRPWVGGGDVFVVGGRVPGAGGRSVPVVEAVSLTSKRRRFVGAWDALDAPGFPPSVRGGLPARTADGGLRLGVHEHGRGTYLLDVDPSGFVRGMRRLLGSEGDLGVKLHVGPAVVDEGGSCWVSTVYRQVRRFDTWKLGPDGGEILFHAPEWRVATTSRVVVGVTAPTREGGEAEWVVRDVDTGAERWRRVAGDRALLGVGEGGLGVWVDTAARRAEGRALEEDVEARWAEGDLEPEDEGALLGRALEAPSVVEAVRLDDGEVVWRVEQSGAVRNVEGCADGVSVLRQDARGHWLSQRGPAGVLLSEVRLSEEPLAWRREVPPQPVLVARDAFRTLVAVDGRLQCFGVGGDAQWSVELPAPCRGYPARRADDGIPVLNAAVDDGWLVLREGPRLWVGR